MVYKRKVSVIIPFYRGQQYISHLLEMMKKNCENLTYAEMDVIIINDSPEIPLDIDGEDLPFRISVYTNEKNMGIHKTRIRGIDLSEAEYIYMLDQDDEVCDNYLQSQLSKISDADFIISNGFVEEPNGNRKEIYISKREQECAVNLMCYYLYRNPIVSPGQVIMRKDAIPPEWKTHAFQANGSDDAYLWILMLEENRKAVLNSDKIYTHISTGENTSLNGKMMMESTLEMAESLKGKVGLWKINRIKRRAKFYGSDRSKNINKLLFLDVGFFRRLYCYLKIR